MKVFHHDDPDGRCSGFWVYFAFHNEPELYEVDYDKTVPIYTVEPNEEVWIVDFSIKPNEMTDLLGITPNVVWIDHHITSLKDYENFSPEVKGKREVGMAGCELTFRYLYPDKEPPEFTKLIADRDLWKFEFGDRTRFFNLGLMANNYKPDAPIWRTLANKENVDKLVADGKVINRFKTYWSKDLRDGIGFDTIFEGYKCYALNIGNADSEYFGDKIKEYDVIIAFSFNGHIFKVSLYSENVDVSKIAKKYGGGGHVGAAGFDSKTLPFVGKSVIKTLEKVNDLSKTLYTDIKKTGEEIKDLKRRMDNLENRVLRNTEQYKQIKSKTRKIDTGD
jgi:uncharacterized protein